MSSSAKANGFIAEAKRYGWKTAWRAAKDFSWVEVTATRTGEKIVIEWNNNQLTGPPQHFVHGVQANLHSAAVAKRTLAAVTPDLDLYHRRSKSATRKAAVQPTPKQNSSNGSAAPEPSVHELPFDIHEDPDHVILNAVRGNTIVYRNTISGLTESALIPYRIADGKNGVKVFNYDLQNVFYLAESSAGRAYLSFMDANGRFRAVALDTLVGVL